MLVELSGQPIAHLPGFRSTTEKHPTERRGERLHPGKRIIASRQLFSSSLQQSHRVKHLSTATEN